MEKHVANYFKAFGFDKGDFIPCELCGAASVDIHHIEPRSKFGTSMLHDQDHVSNLIALCRACHDKAHGNASRFYKGVFKSKALTREFT